MASFWLPAPALTGGLLMPSSRRLWHVKRLKPRIKQESSSFSFPRIGSFIFSESEEYKTEEAIENSSS
ncbi:hypothetical protein V6N13_123707 [Hibiscus sabdariffa]